MMVIFVRRIVVQSLDRLVRLALSWSAPSCEDPRHGLASDSFTD